MAKGVRPPHIDGHPVSLSTYTNYGCRCEGCHTLHMEHYRKWRSTMPDKQRREINRRTSRAKDARMREHNERNKDALPNRGKPWTDREKAIAADPSLTVRQAAELLGRTVFSVKQMRSTQRGR